MPFFDTHCHLDEESFVPDLDAAVTAAREAGVVGMVSIGTDLASSRRTIEIALKYPDVHAAVGVHPNYIQSAKPGDWEEIEKLAVHPRVVAIGETGLDRYWKYSDPADQREWFARHMDLARRVGKPFIVHCRDADDEVREMLRTAAAAGALNGVMHSFCQSQESANECLRLGLMLSFTGMLTFKKNDELRTVAASLPHDRIMVETDAPYLAPTPMRGKRNEPAFVKYTNAMLAEVHGISNDEMADITTANAQRFFGLAATA